VKASHLPSPERLSWRPAFYLVWTNKVEGQLSSCPDRGGWRPAIYLVLRGESGGQPLADTVWDDLLQLCQLLLIVIAKEETNLTEYHSHQAFRHSFEDGKNLKRFRRR
jgi:hypothetical protein